MTLTQFPVQVVTERCPFGGPFSRVLLFSWNRLRTPCHRHHGYLEALGKVCEPRAKCPVETKRRAQPCPHETQAKIPT